MFKLLLSFTIPVVLNLFAEGSQIQTYNFVRELTKNYHRKSIETFCFIAERTMKDIIERLLMAAQGFMGAACGFGDRG